MNVYKLFFSILLLLSFHNLKAIEKSKLKNGDIIFQDLDCGPMCDAIEGVTNGYRGLDFSHMGMVYLRNDSVLIVESIGKGVILTPLESFLSRTSKLHWVGRLKQNYQHLIPQAIGYSLLSMGMPYDDAFLYDNGKYYCSELIYDAFKHANNGLPFFKLYPMTYKTPQSNQFFPVWEKHFAALDMEIPEGKPGCNPGGMSKSRKLKILGVLKL